MVKNRKPCRRDAEALGVALALVLADVVFLAGVDVGVIIKDSWADAVLQHPLYDG